MFNSQDQSPVAIGITAFHTVIIVRFSNGWIVKMGRGLDYFQKPKVIKSRVNVIAALHFIYCSYRLQGQFTIGNNDFDLRPCHETTIEIFHRLNTKKVKSTQK